MGISPASIRGCGMLVIALGAVACGGDPESADAGAEAEMDAGAERGIQMMASGEESTLPLVPLS